MLRIGSASITPLIDGELRGSLEYFYPDDDVRAVREVPGILDAVTGEAIMSIGAYLITDGPRQILVEAGVGRTPRTPPVSGGALRSAMLAVGVAPHNITDVVFTHLHFDHIGWASFNGVPFFPQATYHCDRRDRDYFLDPDYDEPWEHHATHIEVDAARVRLAPVLDRLECWDRPGEILPGLSAVQAAGHTPGSSALLLESEGERALFLGDIAHTIPELLHGWRFRTHVDGERAGESLRAIRDFLVEEDLLCSGSHFPGLQWGRVVRDEYGSFDWVSARAGHR